MQLLRGLAVVVAVGLVFGSFVGCGDDSSSSTTPEPANGDDVKKPDDGAKMSDNGAKKPDDGAVKPVETAGKVIHWCHLKEKCRKYPKGKEVDAGTKPGT